MFNIGGGELIVIALIALIVLGPQRLPEAARQVGKVMGDLKRFSAGFQNELKDAFVDEDTAAAVSSARGALGAVTSPNPVRRAVAAVSAQAGATDQRAPERAAPTRPVRAAVAPSTTSPVARKAAPTAAKTAKTAKTAKAAPASKVAPSSKAARAKKPTKATKATTVAKAPTGTTKAASATKSTKSAKTASATKSVTKASKAARSVGDGAVPPTPRRGGNRS